MFLFHLIESVKPGGTCDNKIKVLFFEFLNINLKYFFKSSKLLIPLALVSTSKDIKIKSALFRSNILLVKLILLLFFL